MQTSTLERYQIELINAFYSGRREAIERNHIPHATLQRLAAKIGYEPDLAIEIMQQLDDHLIKLICDKDKADHERQQMKRR